MAGFRLWLAVAASLAVTLSLGHAEAGAPRIKADCFAACSSMQQSQFVGLKVYASSAQRLRAARWLANLARSERNRVWEMQDLMGLSRTHLILRQPTGLSVQANKRTLAAWRSIRAKTTWQFRNPPHLPDWLCIQSGIKNGRWSKSLKYLGGGHLVGRGEASWKNPGIDWRGNPSIYYGGIQMDRLFQQTYGPSLYRSKGTANNWTPYEQMWVAENALRHGRDFHAWPSTARACGII